MAEYRGEKYVVSVYSMGVKINELDLYIISKLYPIATRSFSTDIKGFHLNVRYILNVIYGF